MLISTFSVDPLSSVPFNFNSILKLMDTAFNLISIEASTTLQLQSLYTRDTIHWKIGSFFVKIIEGWETEKITIFYTFAPTYALVLSG